MSLVRQVGEFPVELHIAMKSNINPYDKSTIVSIYPIAIEDEVKYTIQPGRFNIPAGSYEKPTVVVIGASSWWQRIENMPPIEVQCSSVEVAHSIVQDYCSGLLGCDLEAMLPGIFFIPGVAATSDEVKLKYSGALLSAKIKQDNWYKELVRIADTLWARSNGSPSVIWEPMRLAARMLNLVDKPWLADHFATMKTQCFACGNLKDPVFPICPHCRTVDPNHPKAKEVRTAG